MTIDEAKKIIQMYVEGWKANNANLICRSLIENCVIIESHGPTYHGLKDVKAWVKNWVKDSYKVDSWIINSFYFVESTAIFEWQFAFSSSKSPSRNIDGIIIVKMADQRGMRVSIILQKRSF